MINNIIYKGFGMRIRYTRRCFMGTFDDRTKVIELPKVLKGHRYIVLPFISHELGHYIFDSLITKKKSYMRIKSNWFINDFLNEMFTGLVSIPLYIFLTIQMYKYG